MAGFDVTITIDGLEELTTFLQDKVPNAIMDAVDQSLQDLSDKIMDTTTGLCPVDTGALRDSIDTNINGTTLTAIAGEDYASFVDGGTRFMDAQPFFEEPIMEMEDEFVQDLSDKIQSSLDEIQ